jgi:acetyl-CoA carboxylase carboxyl transferase subunit beta
MGLFSRNKPKIKVQSTRKDGFSGWLKCSGCQQLIHLKELEKNLNCCPKCDHHYRLSAQERIKSLADPDSFIPLFESLRSVDVLEFVDTRPYCDRLKSAQEESGLTEAVLVGKATLEGRPFTLGVLDFNFMGASMGSVVGERITRLIEHSLEYRLPLVTISSSGGARMQESIFSLMQMAKTSAALAKLHEEAVPFISVLTNPTSGGVTASFAALGDVILAEPKALICFAGPRVIEQTIKQKLPPDAQHSEFLMERGMIDSIVTRHELRNKLSALLFYLDGNLRRLERVSRAKSAERLPNFSTSLRELVAQQRNTNPE